MKKDFIILFLLIFVSVSPFQDASASNIANCLFNNSINTKTANESAIKCTPSAVNFSSSSSNTSLNFDESGTADYVEVLHNSDFNLVDGNFAFEAWIYSDLSGNETILSKGNGGGTGDDVYIFQANANGTNKIGLELASNFLGMSEWQYSDTDIPPNQWNHIAVSVQLTTSLLIPQATFYLNGVADGIKTFGIFTLNNVDSNPLYIGRQGHTCACNYFDGRIDDVAIWDKMLIQSDIDASIANGLTGTEPDLVCLLYTSPSPRD